MPKPSPETCSLKFVLLVEDDGELADLIGVALAGAGHTVVWKPNGKEALMAIDTQPFDLALVDFEMPELNGLEFLAAVKNHPQTKTTPVMIMTAKQKPGLPSASIDLGACDFVQKPIVISNLVERVDKVLRG